jgi:hypothetical protein
MKKLLLVFLFTFLISMPDLFAQSSLEVNSLPPFEATQYAKPLATYFGTFFNSGNYYSADVPFTFGFKFSIVGTWSVVPDDQKTFTPNPKLEGVDYVEPSATVFGGRGSYFLSEKGFVVYPTGFALKAVPLGIVQVAGSAFNTELMLRFFPTTNFEDAEVGLFGIGIKHEISTYFQWPLDVSVQFLYNTINAKYEGEDAVKDYGEMSSDNYAFNVHASKTFMNTFIVYGGLQYESSNMKIQYYFDDPNELYPEYIGNQELDIDGENKFRFTLGGAIKLGVFVINGDMNFGSFTTYSAGLSLDF